MGWCSKLTPATSLRGRRILLIILAVLAVGIPVGAGVSNGIERQALAVKQWNDLIARGTLRVGIDPGSRPFSYYGENGWTGMDADIIREVAHRLHLLVAPVPVGYDSLYDSLHLWQVDVVMSAVVADPAETTEFAYSESYFDAGEYLLSINSDPLTATADLSNKRIAVALGSDADRLARFWQRRLINMSRIEAADDEQALTMLRSGRADAMITSGLSAERFVQEAPNIIAATLVSQPYVIALRKDNPILLQHLNDVLNAMRSDGTLRGIVDRWTRR